jgi:hypothetical protein
VSYYDDASLVLIPSGVKTSKVYSQKPTNGNGDLTFTRASTATRTNASGVIESVASNVPRLDYSGGATCPRLLLEPQRTNSIRNSTMVGAVAGSPGTIPTNWSNTQLVGLSRQISLGTENGLSYIDYRFFGTATATDNVRLDMETLAAIAATNGQTWSYSLYAKTANGTISNSQLVMFERNSASGFITQGTLSFSTDSSLQRFTFTRTLSGGATVAFVQPVLFFGVTIGTAYDFTIRIAAPQMELGAYATTFIPTTTAAVTRLADAASKTGVSSLIGQTEGTLFAELITNRTGINQHIELGDGTANNRITLRFTLGFTFQLVIVQAGAVVYNQSSVSTFAQGQRIKIAAAYKSGAATNIYVNGVSVTSATAGTITGNFSAIYLLSNGGTPDPLFSPVSQAALFPTRLTNAQLAEITTL